MKIFRYWRYNTIIDKFEKLTTTNSIKLLETYDF